MQIKFDDTEIINTEDHEYKARFYRIALSTIGRWFGVSKQ